MVPGTYLTRGGTFEVWPRWTICEGPMRYIPDLHYRRDRIGD